MSGRTSQVRFDISTSRVITLPWPVLQGLGFRENRCRSQGDHRGEYKPHGLIIYTDGSVSKEKEKSGLGFMTKTEWKDHRLGQCHS